MTNERLKTLLYNALVWIDEDNGNFWDDDIDNHEDFDIQEFESKQDYLDHLESIAF